MSFVRVTAKMDSVIIPGEPSLGFFLRFTRSVGKPYCDIFARAASCCVCFMVPAWTGIPYEDLAERKVRRWWRWPLKRATLTISASVAVIRVGWTHSGPMVRLAIMIYKQWERYGGDAGAYIVAFFHGWRNLVSVDPGWAFKDFPGTGTVSLSLRGHARPPDRSISGWPYNPYDSLYVFELILGFNV